MLALGGSLVAAEVALRALDLPSQGQRILGSPAIDEDLAPDEVLFWRLSSAPERFVSNRLGLRGWLPSGPKEPGDVRIAVVGDSCTFGSGVGVAESYGARLERLLQEALPAQRIETIFAAMPAYTSHQSRLLYTREIAALEPDVTVLYVGAFNDYRPALGPNDPERSVLRERPWRRALRHAGRVGQLLARATDTERDPENLVEVAGHVRVPLDAFRANVDALVQSALDVGSLPVIVVPPLPPESIEYAPICLDYRAVLWDLAAERGIALLDAPAVFAPWHVELPADWPATARYWPLFNDGVHPSPYGHELLARALLELLAPSVHAWSERPRSNETVPTLGAPETVVVRAIEGPEIVVHGSGFGAEQAFDRVFVDDQWVVGAHVEDDATLRLPLPRHLTAGRHEISLVTRAGTVRGEQAWLEVEPPVVALLAEFQDEHLEISGAIEGPPGWFVRLWASPTLRQEPALTSAGPFWLAADPDGRPAGIEHGPFLFDRLQLASKDGKVDADGLWLVLDMPYHLPPGASEVFFQALLYHDAGQCVLSAPLRLSVTPG